MNSSTIAEYIYTVLLKPKPAGTVTNSVIQPILPATIRHINTTITLNQNDPVISGALTFSVYKKQLSCLRKMPMSQKIVCLNSD